MTSKHGLRLLALPLVALIAVSACEATTVAPSDLRSPAACAVEVLFDEGDPNGLVSGTGFPPDEPATLTIVGPPDPGSPLVLTQAEEPALRTDTRGVVLYRTFPGRENIGTARMTLSAGGCTASTDVVLDESAFPPACPDEPPPLAGDRAAAYEALILADDPVGYWRFEEEAGNPIATAAVGPPAAIQGKAELGQAGVAGSRAIGLRGEGRIAIDPLELPGDFAIEAWMLLCNDRIGNRDGLFASPDGPPNVNFFNAAPRFWTGDEDLVFADDGFLAHDRWYHLALLRAGGIVTLAVDGVSLGSARFADPIRLAWLGDSGDGATSGQLDEFAVYDHALTLEALAERVAAAR
jgi:hypothetical protein